MTDCCQKIRHQLYWSRQCLSFWWRS